MRSSITHEMSLVDNLSVVRKNVELLLNESPQFLYNYTDVLERVEENTDPICDWIEDPQVSYPDIFSSEPIIQGEVQFVLSVVNTETRIQSLKDLENPTWKDLLKELNETLKKNNLTNIILYSFQLVGVTPNGMGYIVEAVTYQLE